MSTRFSAVLSRFTRFPFLYLFGIGAYASAAVAAPAAVSQPAADAR
jgi:hypothetical protein